jgi:hypothetical protein
MPLHDVPTGPGRFPPSGVSASEFREYLASVRETMANMHPSISRYPEIAALVANELAYVMWRKQRVYDHLEIQFGVRTPDGAAGYSLAWHDEREGGRVTTITLTQSELDELIDKASSMEER